MNAAIRDFGDRTLICDVGILDNIKGDIEILKVSNHYGDAAKIIVKHFYNFNFPETDFKINSLVLTAKAEPVVNLIFCLDEKEITVYTS